MIFGVTHTSTASVHNATTAAADCSGRFYCTCITLGALKGENPIPIIDEEPGGKFLPQEGQKQPRCSSLRFFFLSFFFALQNSNDPYRQLTAAESQGMCSLNCTKKPSAQRAQLKTKHANCYNFSLLWVCGKMLHRLWCNVDSERGEGGVGTRQGSQTSSGSKRVEENWD